jgi:hypothetical protein
MATSVFISHAGPDAPAALRVADQLTSRGLTAVIDRGQLAPGDRFLRFMEDALAACDYCLLLWSRAAAGGRWVAVEWEAALYRAIEESRRFLLIGRLDAEPLPALLAPRLYVDLFPGLDPGLGELLSLCGRDAAAATASGRPVAAGTARVPQDPNGAAVYLTSDLFGLTQPLTLDLSLPAGVHLDRVITALNLPRRLDHQGVAGVEFSYRLARGEARIDRAVSLAAAGVRPGDVLWLEAEIRPFAAADPVSGALGQAVFRGIGDPADARRALLRAVTAAGFGMPGGAATRPSPASPGLG